MKSIPGLERPFYIYLNFKWPPGQAFSSIFENYPSVFLALFRDNEQECAILNNFLEPELKSTLKGVFDLAL